MLRPIKYSKIELDWVRDNSTRPRREAHSDFQTIFVRPDVRLDHFNSLCKRHGWLTGRTGCFSKGGIPSNKGKKMPYNANSAKTQFKKGQISHNTKFVGHEYITAKDGYVMLCIDEQNPHTGFRHRYVMKHKYLWEKKNGHVPKGMCLKAIDGDKKNTDPSNWELIPRATLIALNHRSRKFDYDAAPPEAKPVIMTLAKLTHARAARARNIKDS